MATAPNPIEDVLQEFEFPQREAAFFYGLFLRGHSATQKHSNSAGFNHFDHVLTCRVSS